MRRGGDDGEEEEEEEGDEGVRRKGEGWAHAKNSAGVTGGGRVLTRSKEEGGVGEVGVCRWGNATGRGEKNIYIYEAVRRRAGIRWQCKKKKKTAIRFTYCSLWPR